MNHIAIDLGGVKSQVCIRDGAGAIVHEGQTRTAHLGAWLRTQSPGRVILETCSESFAVADAAKSAGHDVRIVPATLVRALGVGAHGVKTDRRDAQALSEVSSRVELRSVHLRSIPARERKARLVARQSLVESRTMIINSVRGWTRTQLLTAGGGAPSTFPKRVRAAAMARPDGLPAYVEQQLAVIETLNAHIKQADTELKKLAKEDAAARRLMTAPGVGPVTAHWVLAALDDVKRFPSAKAVVSYLGLTPGERSSSTRTRRTSITKAGSPQARWALGQACWSAWNHAPSDPLVQWGRAVAERRGRPIAIVAMSRKLAGILYAMLRDETDYDPTHTAQRRSNEEA